MSLFDYDRPEARTDGLVAERVDRDLVIYDETSRMAHCLSGEVAPIWDRLDGRMTPSQIASSLEIPKVTVVKAVDELREAGLLVETAPGHTRRDFGKRFAAVGGATLAGSAFLASMPVPAALAACSHHVCGSSGSFSDWDPMSGPFPESMWFTSTLTQISPAPTATTVLLVTGSISLPNLLNGPVGPLTMIPMRITFSNTAAAVTLNYTTDPSLFGGAVFGDEVVPLGCANAKIFLGGLMYLSNDAMTPSATKDWTWDINIDFPGAAPAPTITWQFGASGYHVGTATTSAAQYNALGVRPVSGGAPCGSNTNSGDQAGTLEGVRSTNDTGSGSGGSFIGSGSGQLTCTPICA